MADSLQERMLQGGSPTAYLFLHLNFIILFRRYGAPVRFLRSYIHDSETHRHQEGHAGVSSVNDTQRIPPSEGNSADAAAR